MRLVLATLALATAACTPTRYRADLGVAVVKPRGDVSLQNSAGTLNLDGNKNDLKSDLDLGDQKSSPYLRFEVDWGPQRVRASGFAFENRGDGILSHDFGDLPGGSAVSTKIEFFNTSVAWSYDLLKSDRFRLAPGAQLAFYSLDVDARAVGSSSFETVSIEGIVPEVLLSGEVDLGWASMAAEAAYMKADVGDADGGFGDIEAVVRVHPSAKIEVFAGYRYILLDADGHADGRDFQGDVTIDGWLFGGGIRF